MTKLFNFIIFMAIVYLFFNISVTQFEKFTDIFIKINPIKKNKVIQIKNLTTEKKIIKTKDAIVEDDHYDQKEVVNIDSIDSQINASDIISDMEGRSISDKSCSYELSATNTEAGTDCDSKTINNKMLNKPIKEIFNKIIQDKSDDMPKTIKDIYNKMVTPEKGSTENVKTQGGYTMNIDSNKYTTIKGQEKIVTQLTKSLHANDPNYDSYSMF
jgi:hypothetical protein